MNDIPESAIKSAAEAISGSYLGIGPTAADKLARVAIEAAMPVIREAIAQDIEGARSGAVWNGQYNIGLEDAAQIVRDYGLPFRS